jgi:hypothetical protein
MFPSPPLKSSRQVTPFDQSEFTGGSQTPPTPQPIVNPWLPGNGSATDLPDWYGLMPVCFKRVCTARMMTFAESSS